MKMLHVEAMQDGYDSDGQLGPFIAKDVTDEADYCINENLLRQKIEICLLLMKTKFCPCKH